MLAASPARSSRLASPNRPGWSSIVRAALEPEWYAVYPYSNRQLTFQYIFVKSPYWLNLKELWTNFPTQQLDPLVKYYYLVQFAFWLQQLFVVNIEERRKDHWQMFTHHIFTSALLFTSYGFYQTKVGNVILCLMDGVDILLSVSRPAWPAWPASRYTKPLTQSSSPKTSITSNSVSPATSLLVSSSSHGS